jgi:hypothetical protein
MPSTRDLARWLSGSGILILLASLACTVWVEFSTEHADRLQATTLGAICGIAGLLLVCLGIAFSRIARLEEQVRALEQRQATRAEPVSPEPGGASDRGGDRG